MVRWSIYHFIFARFRWQGTHWLSLISSVSHIDYCHHTLTSHSSPIIKIFRFNTCIPRHIVYQLFTCPCKMEHFINWRRLKFEMKQTIGGGEMWNSQENEQIILRYFSSIHEHVALVNSLEILSVNRRSVPQYTLHFINEIKP